MSGASSADILVVRSLSKVYGKGDTQITALDRVSFSVQRCELVAIVGVAILLKVTQEIVSQLIVDADQGMTLVLSPLVIGLTILFSAATVLLSAWIPARRASRVSPIDAIRQRGEIQEGAPLNLRTSPLIRRELGFKGELALDSVQRDGKKYRATELSLTISIILFVAFNALLLGLPIGIALSVFIYEQFGGVSTLAFTLPWGAILACVAGTLAIVCATMVASVAMLCNDTIVDAIKAENL